VTEYEEVLAAIRRADEEVLRCVRVGSHVYGTARPGSDRDYAVVLHGDGRQDLARGRGIDVVVHSARTWGDALDAHNVFALEIGCAPAAHTLKDGRLPTRVRVDPARARDAARERSDADFAKAEARWTIEPDASRKRLFHALRVPAFARCFVQTGGIDFAAARHWWELAYAADAPSDLSTDRDALFAPCG
jgi:hypothetical protein